MKIRCAVIDDDISDLKAIKNYLNSISVETRYEFEGTYISKPDDPLIFNQYDIYVFDIDMPKINGFILAKQVLERHPDSTIVFCSSHEDLVFDSFKLNTSYFIRKSFLKEDLILAIKKYIRQYEQKNVKYIISNSSGTYAILLSDIIYFEVVQNYLYIHTKNHEFKERKTLTKLESELLNSQFIKISQNFIINCDYINDLDNCIVNMKNGLKFTISRRNVKYVTEKYYLHLAR